jgi:signal transduction histidine kinase
VRQASAYNRIMPNLTPEEAVAAIGRIDAVPLILEVICRTTGMGFAAVARVTEDRWVACRVRDLIDFGLKPGGELKVETTICDQIRDSGEAVIIEHVAEDQVYCGHPTAAMYGFESYISMPIRRSSGAFFGTLCAIDPRPARLKTPEIAGMFKLFAELIACQLDAQDRLERGEAALAAERETAELREQFIAVLGHDLRNPLAAIDAGTRHLLRQSLDEKSAMVVRLMQTSVKRMAGLIDSVMDFARGHLGSGLYVNSTHVASLQTTLQHVVDEVGATAPGRAIDAAFHLRQTVDCDSARIGQLLSNLLANAVTHGAAESPINVCATAEDGRFILTVANTGPAIPPAALERLFQPFYRTAGQANQQGLGLGLYIASMIAQAHGGTLTAASSPVETVFTFRMPADRSTLQ